MADRYFFVFQRKKAIKVEITREGRKYLVNGKEKKNIKMKYPEVITSCNRSKLAASFLCLTLKESSKALVVLFMSAFNVLGREKITLEPTNNYATKIINFIIFPSGSTNVDCVIFDFLFFHVMPLLRF